MAQHYVQANVSAADHAITFPWESDRVTISASADLWYSFDSSIPAASGMLLDISASPYTITIETTSMRIAADAGSVDVGVLAEQWDAKSSMTPAHPRRDILGWENRAVEATRVGNAADGDT